MSVIDRILLDPHDRVRRSEDVRARSWLLFNMVLGEASERRPKGLEVADEIEWLVSVSEAGSGARLGTEADFARHFCVGRRVARQASRSLLARGVITAQRGRTGGYLVARTELTRAVEACAQALPGEQRAAAVALSLVADALGAAPGEAGRFCLAAMRRIAAARPTGVITRSVGAGLAQMIAENIEADLENWRAYSMNDRSGVLEAMAERYGVSLTVAVQAVRLLEDAGLVQMNKGRTGGVQITTERSCARAIRIVHAYFATNDVSIAECDSLVRVLNIALIQQAISAGMGNVAAIEAAFAAMLDASDPTSVGMRWYALQRALSERAANPVLHLLVKCFAGFLVRVRTRQASLDRTQAGALIAASKSIVDGVKDGRSDGSAEAHLRCQQALAASW